MKVKFKDRWNVVCEYMGDVAELSLKEGLFGLSKFTYNGADHYVKVNYDADRFDEDNRYIIFRAHDDKLIAYGSGETITYNDLRCTAFLFTKWFCPALYA